MKALKAALLIIMLLTAVSCKDATAVSTASKENTQQGVQSLIKTDKLVLYRGDRSISDLIDYALPLYKQKFPEVEVEIRDFGNLNTTESFFNYYEVLKSELMAGKGPDLVLWAHHFDDVYKVMESGVFANLDDFINADSSLNLMDFNESIMSAGVYKNNRYFMPIDYRVEVFVTAENAQQSAGTVFEQEMNFQSFAQQTEKYLKANKNLDEWLTNENAMDFYMRLLSSGYSFANYEEEKVIIDEASFKKFMEWYKAVYSFAKQRKDKEIYFPQGYPQGDCVVMSKNNKLLLCQTTTLYNFGQCYGGLLKDNEPTWFLAPQSEGEKAAASIAHSAAIRKNSQNTANAYEFLKILLSDQVQSSEQNYSINLPVRSESLSKKVKSVFMQKSFFYGDGDNDPNLYYISSIPQELAEEYILAVSDVIVPKGNSLNVYNFICEEMQPYLDNEKSFENCMSAFKNKLELYLQE